MRLGQSKLRPLSMAVTSTLAIWGGASPAHAQEAAAAASSVDDIIVTAQRRQENLQDVPVAVSAISGDTLATRNLYSFQDLATQVPALKVIQTNTDAIHLRGVGSGYNPGFEQAVATFIDGAYRPRSRSSRVALFDVERVEVLKGPQSLFFGANAVAGALNITTRHPGSEFGANATALYGTEGEYNLEGGLTVPLNDDWSFRIAARTLGMDEGWVNNITTGDDGPQLDTKQARASIHFGGDNLTADFRYDIARIRDTDFFYQTFECPSSNPVIPPAGACARALGVDPNFDDTIDFSTSGGGHPRTDTDMDEAELTLRYDLGWGTLISTSVYENQDSFHRAELIPVPGLSPIGTVDYLPVGLDEQFDMFGQEFRLESATGGAFDYMVGVYYEDNSLDVQGSAGNFFLNFAAFTGGLIPSGTPIVTWTETGITSETESVFGSLSWNASDDLRFTGGLRYTTVTKDGTRLAYAGVGGYSEQPPPFVRFTDPAVMAAALAATGTSPAPFPVSEQEFDELMPSLNVSYDINDDTMTYASYTTGFKAGGFGAATPDIFDSETVDAYEIGLKSRLFDHRLTANIAVFFADYTNLQETFNTTTSTGQSQVLIRNAASSRSKGVDINLRYRATDAWTFWGDAEYLDSYYVSYPNSPCNPIETFLGALPGGTPCLASTGTDASGRTRAFSPEWSGTVGADFSKPVGGLEFTAGVTLNFTTAYFTQSLSSYITEQEAYTKIDARIGLGSEDGRWLAQIIGRNLTDEVTSQYRSYLPGNRGSGLATVDRPASVALQLTMNW